MLDVVNERLTRHSRRGGENREHCPGQSQEPRIVAALVGRGVAADIAVVSAAWLRFIGNSGGSIFFESAPSRAVVFAVLITVSMVVGLYQVRTPQSQVLHSPAFSFAFGGIALLVLYYLIRLHSRRLALAR
jgi:hypothetical protein